MVKKTAVIMAGGKGERFWPQSRAATPKQFLSLTSDGKTMLQLTVERLLPSVDIDDIFIATNKNYKAIVQAQLPGLPERNILCEPIAKNTAPCIAYAAAVIAARYEDAVMYVMPSDHVVHNQPLFTDTLALAARVAEQEHNLVTLGVTPSYPETGYGYICFKKETLAGIPGVYEVERFVEKPDLPTAESYIEQRTYLWNSGMFIWKASSFLSNLASYAPEVAAAASMIQAAPDDEEVVLQAFEASPSISVDYAVMEKAANIYTIPSNFGWDDVGGWLALSRINPVDESANLQLGNVISIGCENSTFVSGKRLIAAVGVKDVVLVETEDAIMLCGKDEAQRVKELVEELKQRDMKQYL